MMEIVCPYCGPRNDDEFLFMSEERSKRSDNTAPITNREWVEYMFYRNNIKGLHYEHWLHRYGCRQLIRVARCTVTHEIFGTWRFQEKVPDISELDSA